VRRLQRLDLLAHRLLGLVTAMTIYVVMKHAPGAQSAPVSAWRFMTDAAIDVLERECANPGAPNDPWYTIEPVNLGGEK